MMLLCIKEHLSSIWSSIHEKKLSNTEIKLKKKAFLIKKVRILTASQTSSKD